MTTAIPPTALRDHLTSPHLLLLDVRTPPEFAQLHATPAQNLPLDQLTPSAVAALRTTPDQPIYLICQSGQRSAKALQLLTNAGLSHLHTIEGGTAAWQAAVLPVTRGTSKVISLERQVRIAAGLLVLTGTALTYFLHPAFLLLPAFIGAGLTFAGLTNTCGMAMLLTKMPWNR